MEALIAALNRARLLRAEISRFGRSIDRAESAMRRAESLLDRWIAEDKQRKARFSEPTLTNAV